MERPDRRARRPASREGTGALVVNLQIRRHASTPETISFWNFAVGSAVPQAVFGRPALCLPPVPVTGVAVSRGQERVDAARLMGSIWGLSVRESRQRAA